VSVFRFIAAERAYHPVNTLCRVLGVSRSGFHAWVSRPPSPRELADRALLVRVRQLHLASRRTYGSPRIYHDLRADGVAVGCKRVERLMRQDGLSGTIKRRRGRTIRVPGVRVADDLVKRDFRPPAPDTLWVAAITYLRTWEGWLYLTVVVDCYSRRVVGWALEDHLRAELVVDALERVLTGVWRGPLPRQPGGALFLLGVEDARPGSLGGDRGVTTTR
jgi:putative transposase